MTGVPELTQIRAPSAGVSTRLDHPGRPRSQCVVMSLMTQRYSALRLIAGADKRATRAVGKQQTRNTGGIAAAVRTLAGPFPGTIIGPGRRPGPGAG